MVNRFSKAVHFIYLSKLPSSNVTGDLLDSHVFRLHGFLRDIVSDQGLQFTSRLWKAFCNTLGASVSW